MFNTDKRAKNVLFICSRNQWRSPTAERIFSHQQGLNVRSAGTSQCARRTVSSRDLDWADVIYVMEEHHKKYLRSRFREAIQHCVISVLDIPDEYSYMAPELVELLQRSLAEELSNCAR